MKTEHRIAYKAGITRTPSDFLCEDGELAECINLTTENEELKVMVKPGVKIAASRRLLFVHKLPNGSSNYIYDSGIKLYNGDTELSNSQHTSSVKGSHIRSVGRFVIVALDGVLTYYLWKDDAYVFEGHGIPAPDMSFGLSGEPGTKIRMDNIVSSFKYISVGAVSGVSGAPDYIVTDKALYDDSVKGLYAKGKSLASQQKSFVNPFMVRYALKLYDDSYTHISNPIPLFPNATNSCLWNRLQFYIHGMFLVYKNFHTYEDWTDLVKSISIFVSRGVELYDLSLDSINGGAGEYQENDPVRFNTVGGSQDSNQMDYHFPFERFSSSEVSDDLASESIFYHLCDISATVRKDNWSQMKDHFSHRVLDFLETQDRLPYDGYYSLAPLSSDYLYDYNNRLNLARVKRGFFQGFYSYIGLYDNQNADDYDVYVRISSESGTRVVKKTVQQTSEVMGFYFFYPDPRANHVTIVGRVNGCVLDADLVEHPGLNGAYYLRGWPDIRDYPGFPSYTASLNDNDVNTSPEDLSGYIVTSEVSNPFVFLAHGYNRVGTGYIVSMVAQTHALSQGQFGEYPLLVFTSEGIWAMSVDETGLYSSMKPMSREVCVYGESITQTDDSIFFVSKAGLMRVFGGQVVCVSESVHGKSFNTQDIDRLKYAVLDADEASEAWASAVLAASDSSSFHAFALSVNCRIAFDYMSRLLLLFNGTKDYCWVYSIADGSFSKMSLIKKVDNVVNAYPDYLYQDSDNKVYSLYERVREEDVASRQNGFLLTRPMKLSGPVSVKSLRELVNVGCWSKKSGSKVKTQVFVSDNLEDWYEMGSRFGAAAKYFRIALYIEMKPTERLSGTILFDQERRDGNVRVNPTP